LPGPADYDDLFYKVVETGEIFLRFHDICMASLPLSPFFSFSGIFKPFFFQFLAVLMISISSG
jgi:hypothetical protein